MSHDVRSRKYFLVSISLVIFVCSINWKLITRHIPNNLFTYDSPSTIKRITNSENAFIFHEKHIKAPRRTSKNSLLKNKIIHPSDSIRPIAIDISDPKYLWNTTTTYDHHDSRYNGESLDYYQMIRRRYHRLRNIRIMHHDFFVRLFQTWFSNDWIPIEFLLVDPAYHDNVGDSMITDGEIKFITNYITEQSNKTKHIELRQCSYLQANDHFTKCDDLMMTKKNPNRIRKIALWHGGGNWGSLWRSVHTVRIESFQSLLSMGYDYIISMPQSFHYETKDQNYERIDAEAIAVHIARGLGLFNESIKKRFKQLRKEKKKQINLDETSNLISSLYIDSLRMLQQNSSYGDRIIFTWRDYDSYIKAIELYPYVTNVIVPDIAFQLGPYNGPALFHNVNAEVHNIPPKTDLLFLLRSDRESILSQYRSRRTIQNMIYQIVTELDSNTSSSMHDEYFRKNRMITFSLVDWNDRLSRFHSTDIFFTDTAIQLLSSGKIVITDRLHASILSYLSGLPFVYIEPISQKISKTFHVAFCHNNHVEYRPPPPNLSSSEQPNFCYDTDQEMFYRATSILDAIHMAIQLLVKYKI